MSIGSSRTTLLVALVATAACRSGTGPDRRLVVALARWAEQSPASYRITVSRSCECLSEMSGPVVVAVSNGAVESRHYTSTGAVVPSTYAASFPSVDGLFEIIEAARREGAAQLDVTYDPTYGYPTEVVFDNIRNAIDDEQTYTITDYRPT